MDNLIKSIKKFFSEGEDGWPNLKRGHTWKSKSDARIVILGAIFYILFMLWALIS